MIEKILNLVFLRNFRLNKNFRKLLDNMESEFAEEALQSLLTVMKLAFHVNKDFRRNIENFNGKYCFRSRDGSITISAIFEKGKMKVREKEIEDSNVMITFKNAKALLNFLFSPKPDILNSVLRQDVAFAGNLNYLSKFAYMATRLRLMATGEV